MKNKSPQSEIVLYSTPKGDVKVKVFFREETLWLTMNLIAELFDTTKQNVSSHIKNIFLRVNCKKNQL